MFNFQLDRIPPFRARVFLFVGVDSAKNFGLDHFIPHLLALHTFRPFKRKEEVVMKAFVVIALVALVVLAGVEAGRDRHGGRGGHRDRVRASSKTIVTQPDGMHRFCIPIGKKAAQVDSLSLHVPRTALGFQVKLDTFPTSTFSSPLAQDDTTCKKLSSLFLVKDKQAVSTFNYATSEIVKDGAIAGVIYGPRPEWISVQLKGSQITTVDHGTSLCHPFHSLMTAFGPTILTFSLNCPSARFSLFGGTLWPIKIFSLYKPKHKGSLSPIINFPFEIAFH